LSIFELHRGEVVQGTVSTIGIVKVLDVVGNGDGELNLGSPLLRTLTAIAGTVATT